ncbi:HAD-superfamily hydrolase [Serendipita vermifera]|nr:HAD-superfamily hydrolase [Serendipita vermifera]
MSIRLAVPKLVRGRQFLNQKSLASSLASASSPPKIAFAFDIDGVLTQGSHVLPQAKRILRFLDGSNAWARKFPYILMTNGGGKPEVERCKELSEKLETNIDLSMFMQSHTIIGSPVLPYLAKYREKPIMVLGGKGDVCRHIAMSYGFQNVLIPADVMAWNPDIWPFYQLSPAEQNVARKDIDFASVPIEAIFVFHDPLNWGPDTQIALDIVRYGSKTHSAFVRRGTPNPPPDSGLCKEERVELVFSNPDLLWKGAYARSRLGQGGFREAFQGVHHALDGQLYPAKQLGKPSRETYTHAEDMLLRRMNELYGGEADMVNKRSIYMIGDNPESDIAGANAAGWNSILVHTGVYSPSSGSPLHKPTMEADDVEKAVEAVLEAELRRANIRQ